MDSTQSAAKEALLGFELLSDRSGRPAALLLRFDPPTGLQTPAVLSSAEFRRICTDLSCLYIGAQESGLSDAFVSALAQACCQPVSSLDIHRSPDSDFSSTPEHARWIGGTWYLSSPANRDGRTGTSKGSTLQLLQLVSADAPTREIEAVFKRDPALSWHLLRLVNSVGIGSSRRITSLSQAIMILGRQQLRRWLNLLLFAAREEDPRGRMLLARAVCHARLLELLAQDAGHDRTAQDQAFMAGLFSLLGILFGMSLEEVLKPLSIGEGVRRALLQREGELGRNLDLADAALRCDLPGLASGLKQNGTPFGRFNTLQIEACTWMRDVLRNDGA